MGDFWTWKFRYLMLLFHLFSKKMDISLIFLYLFFEKPNVLFRKSCRKKVKSNEDKKKKRKAKGTSGRDEKECPVCQKMLIRLSQHMRITHKWDDKKAATVVTDFNLRKARQYVLPEKRKTKKRPPPTHRFICQFRDPDTDEKCDVSVLNIRQHCRQEHGLRGKRLKRYQDKAWPVLIEKELSTEDETEVDTSEEERDDDAARAEIIKNVNVLGMDFGKENAATVERNQMVRFMEAKFETDESPDFLAEDYVENWQNTTGKESESSSDEDIGSHEIGKCL